MSDVHAIAFRYLQNPHRFSTYSERPQACALCGETKPGYRGPFYGSGNAEFVCEGCLAAGKLAEQGLAANDGDVASLRRQLHDLNPALDEERCERLVRERTTKLEQRTPHLVTWQDFGWPAHCGDYMRFIAEVGQPDLSALAQDGDGQSFLATHLHEQYREQMPTAELWLSIRPDSPRENTNAYTVGVWLFQCLHCGTYVILWDCE